MANKAGNTEKTLGELAPFWEANPETKTLLQVGDQIFLDDKQGMESAQAYAYRANLDIFKIERPK